MSTFHASQLRSNRRLLLDAFCTSPVALVTAVLVFFRCQQLIEAVGGEGDWRAVGDAGAVGTCSRIGEEGGPDLPVKDDGDQSDQDHKHQHPDQENPGRRELQSCHNPLNALRNRSIAMFGEPS